MRKEKDSIERGLQGYTLVSQAILLADRAHEGQVRKSDGSPYIHHPIQVGFILSRHGYPPCVVAAGILHDVIEDTGTTYEQLVLKVGKEVADLVGDVTEPSKKLPWKERKRVYLEHLKVAPLDAVAISIADRIHNKASLLVAYGEQGVSVFSRFNKDFSTTLDNDFRVMEVYKERLGENHPLVVELQEYLEEIEKIGENF